MLTDFLYLKLKWLAKSVIVFCKYHWMASFQLLFSNQAVLRSHLKASENSITSAIFPSNNYFISANENT